MNVKARKMEINLITLGTGVILFSAWLFIKFALSYLIYGSDFDEELDEEMMTAANIFLWITAALSSLIYFYIGQSARSEGKGKRKSGFYLFLTGTVILFGALAILLEIVLLSGNTLELIPMLVTLIIDITSQVILIELMVNAVGIRKLRKKEAQAHES